MGHDQSKLNEKFLLACTRGDCKKVQHLLKKGADLDSSNASGENALHRACMSPECDDRRKILVLFLLRKSDGKLLRGNVYGHLPTSMALLSRDIGFLETFLESGYVRLDDKVNDSRDTALTVAEKAAIVHRDSPRFKKIVADYWQRQERKSGRLDRKLVDESGTDTHKL